MEDNELLFTDLKLKDGSYAKDCQRKILSPSVSLFYKIGGEGNHPGFDFVAMKLTASRGICEDVFEDPELQVEILFHGIVYYDGLRHLYQGREDCDNEGYLYYFNTMDGIRIFTALRELENEFCMISELED